MNIEYRKATLPDVVKLSILFKQVYISTYGTEGVSDEFANFITKQFSIERLEKIISDTPENIVLAVYKNNLVGVAEIEFNKQCPIDGIVGPELNKLYILEWFCGKGIGEKLLTEVEKIVLSKGVDKFWLWVLETNSRAISFYEKHNFESIGNASFQMEVNKYENVVMIKNLK